MKSVHLLVVWGFLVGSPAIAKEPTSQPFLGPKVVMLNALEDQYEPVPFAHARHAEMAQMWDGCVTCHHIAPDATTPPSDNTHPTTQADSGKWPQCKGCHAVVAEKADIHRPTLKGAYHRQCLDCHREWTGENACGNCHAAKDGIKVPAPSVDDITGRMHPPIKAKDEIAYKARFEPVAGPNVLFRHKEHVKDFGLKCAQCHRRDNCNDCHAKDASTRPTIQPMKAGRTWAESHSPCVECHKSDSCDHCHHKDGAPAPAAFSHASTGQTLDKDHVQLACAACHDQWYVPQQPGCGEASCHRNKAITFPHDRPGPFVVAFSPTTKPTTTPITTPTTAPATEPTTRPLIIRIRRGGK
ncbi:hypothetical protein BH10PLA1_BH10PLA1_16830 [soil metagenome]